jgi:hypothetical protein
MGPQTWDKTAQLLKQASSLWPEVVKQPDIPPAVLKQLANEFIQASTWPKGDRKKAIDQIYPAIEAALPHSTIPLELKGRFYVDYAWEARGGGWAKDVTPANAKLFMERLAVAEQALTKASEMSPNEPDAATVMIEVELGQGRGRDVMEKWFARATKANPDNVDAYRAKLRYLQPKWHGTTAALNAFATECRNTRNWYARLPIVSLEAHDALAEASGNPDAYYRSPSVWRDVEAVLRPWIDAFPDDAAGRSRLAYFACKCQHWDEAKRQFAALGDNAVPDQFGDPAMLPLCRMEAARH